MELILRFIGYSKAEVESMEEKEVWRKAFAGMDIIREVMESLAGAGSAQSQMPPAPPNYNPMAAYGAAGPE